MIMEDIMLFYNFETLDFFIEKDLNTNIREEEKKLNNIIQLYKNKRQSLLTLTTDMIENTNTINQNQLEKFYNTTSDLKTIFEKVDFIINKSNNLKNDLINILSLSDKGLDLNKNEIKANLVEYNKQIQELYDIIFEFENNSINIFNTTIELSLNISNKKLKRFKTAKDDFKHTLSQIDVECNHQDNNILIISEFEQKAYLPFRYKDIENIFKNSKDTYSTMQDVVNDLYIIPLKKFKNSSLSRFRESFKLMREKEKSSIPKALDLGLELMFKYELNPIIIAACRNLDELDIYLDCLDENELYDFDCFEIKFEIAPQIVKKNKSESP